MEKVMMYRGQNDSLIPSLTGSYLAWRKFFQDQGKDIATVSVEVDPGGMCVKCGHSPKHTGNLVLTNPYGIIVCVCSIKKSEEERDERLRKYRKIVETKTLDEWVEWGNAYSQASIAKTKAKLDAWLSWPSGWITMVGQPGVGKSHLLTALEAKLKGWAFYLPAAYFETLVFKYLDKNDLNAFVTEISTVPWLLFDDYGAGHNSEFTTSVLRKIIDARYSLPYEYPTVVTSNLMDSGKLRMLDARIGDRILDVNIGQRILIETTSFRNRK